VAPTVEDLNSESGPAIELYCAGADIPAERKMQLMRLAWDASCSSFAGRQNLYEKFFAGDPWRNAAIRAERYPSAREAQDRVWAFLDRNDAWEERINGGLSKTDQQRHSARNLRNFLGERRWPVSPCQRKPTH